APTIHEPRGSPTLLRREAPERPVPRRGFLVGAGPRGEHPVSLPATPAGRGGRIDLRPLADGIRQLGAALRPIPGRRLVVVKSSVTSGTTETILRPLLEAAAGKSSAELSVATNPEFLAEGTMVGDVLHPERIVIGVSRPRDQRLLRRLYGRFGAPIVTLSTSGAELVKYASNAFLATKVTLANEFARVAETVGVDVDPVMAA
ncbi:UDP-glucose 6-dehydrogenase, partial [mine drainage metagenome]